MQLCGALCPSQLLRRDQSTLIIIVDAIEIPPLFSVVLVALK